MTLAHARNLRFRALALVMVALLAATLVVDLPASAHEEDPHTTHVPSAATNVSATPGNMQITVRWSPPEDDGGSDITGYQVQWRPTAGGVLNYSSGVSASDRSYTIMGWDVNDQPGNRDPLVNGTNYTVWVRAFNFEGSSGAAGAGSVSPVQGPLTASNEPQNVTVTPEINSLDVSWGPPVLGVNNAPTNYKVDWNPGGEYDAGTANSYTIPNLNAGTTYQVRVRAENSAGGTWSGNVPGVPVAGPQVTSVTVDQSTINDSGATVNVTIANPDAMQQTVYYCFFPTATGSCSAQSTTTSAPHTSLSLAPTNLAPNTQFEVRASLDMNMVNNVRTARFTTHGPPNKPSISVAPGDEVLNVSWSVNLNGGTVSSQSVEWKLASAGSYTDSADPGASARSHQITGLTNETDYTVRVTVFTQYGMATSDEVTRAPAPGPTVSEIAFSNIGQNSATAAVTVINLQLATGDVTAHLRYRVQGSTEDDDWSEPLTRSVSRSSSTRTVSFNLSGLTGNTMYDVQAVATEGSAAPDWTESFQQPLMTAPSPPHPPENLTVTHGNAQLTVTWMAPTNNGGSDVTGYAVQWKSGSESYSAARQETADYDAGTDTVSNTEISYASGEFSYDITGLTNGREYTVQVFAKNVSGNGSSAEEMGTPSTTPQSPPANVLAAECDSSLHLSWQAPSNDGGSPITSYTIQWKSVTDVDYDDTDRQVVRDSSELMYTLGSLTNGTEYIVRLRATNKNGGAMNSDGDPLWSAEATGTPREGTCISGIRFGNILADSAPVIVDVKDAEAGTDVYMRYRSSNPGAWSETQHMTVGEGETSITFDITGLTPSKEYEVETSLDNGFAAQSTARAFFTAGEAPTSGRIGGGSFSRILRIEPTISSVTVSAGEQVSLSVDVYGRQNELDNGLADRDDNRPEFTWSDDGAGSFAEADIPGSVRNSAADDREVMYTAPANAGRFEVTAELLGAGDCLDARRDESLADAEARCTATINVTVRRRSAAEPRKPTPVNPPGAIPETLTDTQGTAYAVFTPEDGGDFLGEGYSLSAGPGAVANGEFIGVSMTPMGDASNTGQTHHRYTLAGSNYAITVVDASGARVNDYSLGEPVTACVRLPDQLRANISDIVLAATNDGEDLSVLATTVKITGAGVDVCGATSYVPTTVAVGAFGAPAAIPEPTPELAPEDTLPDTGDAAPGFFGLILLMLLGVLIAGLGVNALRRRPSG